MNKDLVAIFEYLEREKGIKRDVVISAIEESLYVAARKSIHGGLINVSVQVNPKTGDINVIAQKEVVELVTIPEEEISLAEARVLHPDCELGQFVDISVIPQNFGRIAAHTAGQIISQKLRHAERDVIYEEYRHRINEIVSGTVKKVIREKTLIIDLGKVEGILPSRFYPKTEEYNLGDRVQALLFEVRDTENGGAEVILSRSHPEFVAQLFSQEVPEIADDTIVIEKIVRAAGYRTKIAVSSQDPKVDPVGACVGVRGNRVKNIIRELNNEKIDIIPFNSDATTLLKSSLAPIEIKKMIVDEQRNVITIVINDEDYPVALGKGGRNARLNGELCGSDLQIQKMSHYKANMNLEHAQMASADDPTLDEPLTIEEVSSRMIIESLISAGYDTPRKVLNATPEQLAIIPEISLEMADKILEKIRKKRG
ncbi:Transcription termination/antitermination protein NusA [Candidatus Rhabdochlamydia oedothoracis]|uniref:Transcription termination/antitermination protein NusA n=1 Tax=Candidatus Rhabdochlamydia oedothoracis TaxID=2720720 RepID=A0ABX8V656_9BACT|nr:MULTISPECIES: transcription termination factor NusA [Rhabdochlamydia]KAG6558918.1 Transcription termination/antitermination protein NusA [Candidatus Rhabdochlamydia sp. W815]MCL6756741.1 transcription termination factor NusA [Candidatus Rhabdochlamydia oedothoracis]QYF49062.1 Transcription termination/antitermination protein NusA [Candidatus Rhabdochlamydia oedothoracis]